MCNLFVMSKKTLKYKFYKPSHSFFYSTPSRNKVFNNNSNKIV